jgi:hypothetical protein
MRKNKGKYKRNKPLKKERHVNKQEGKKEREETKGKE